MFAMNIRSVYPLKSFASMKEAQVYVRKIKAGTSKHSDSQLEIHWNKKAHKKASLSAPKSVSGVFTQLPPQADEVDDSLQWVVVVVNEDPIPGGVECAECSNTHFEDDYLCPDCRAAL
jgi:hypothetical protein